MSYYEEDITEALHKTALLLQCIVSSVNMFYMLVGIRYNIRILCILQFKVLLCIRAILIWDKISLLSCRYKRLEIFIIFVLFIYLNSWDLNSWEPATYSIVSLQYFVFVNLHLFMRVTKIIFPFQQCVGSKYVRKWQPPTYVLVT